MRESKRIQAEKRLMEHLEKLCLKKDHGVFIYEIYPDYRDEISDEAVDKILRFDEPRMAFDDWIYEAYWESENWTKREIIKDVMHGIFPEDEDEEAEIEDYLEQMLMDLLDFEYPYDHFLKQEIRADLMIDTGDGNYDYTCNSVYPHYYGEKGSGIEKAASLVWLAETQGYSKRQLEKALDEGDVAKPKGFLDTVRQEVANETSTMNCLTFLVKMTVEDLIRLNELIKLQEPNGEKIFDADLRPDCGSLKISKKANPGLYDPWYGAGSLFEIELEKDIVLPIKYIRSCFPDCHFRWSVDSVYGMMGSAWKDVVSDIKGPEEETECIAS